MTRGVARSSTSNHCETVLQRTLFRFDVAVTLDLLVFISHRSLSYKLLCSGQIYLVRIFTSATTGTSEETRAHINQLALEICGRSSNSRQATKILGVILLYFSQRFFRSIQSLSSFLHYCNVLFLVLILLLFSILSAVSKKTRQKTRRCPSCRSSPL